MFTGEEYKAWCYHFCLSHAACSLINWIRSSEPARSVHSRHNNVSGRYPSRKMGRTIHFESHRNELALILELEHDAEVREYYDQPPPVKLNYASAKGRQLGVLHTRTSLSSAPTARSGSDARPKKICADSPNDNRTATGATPRDCGAARRARSTPQRSNLLSPQVFG